MGKSSKLSPELRKKLTDYAEEIKFIGGYKEYRVSISDARQDDPASFAEVLPDDHEKILLIKLFRNFYTLEWWQQKNVISHEMIHGRIFQYTESFKYLTEKIHYEVEEQCVNDLTRGFEELIIKVETLKKQNSELIAELENYRGRDNVKEQQ